ncbi:MAG: hypothetical protein QOJ50_2648, partial [Cryptosporangiaceae bacterium]|nr:hypothetical protein [Cryptosporangiaceae bacterium]
MGSDVGSAEPQPRAGLDLLSDMLDGRTMQLRVIPWAEPPPAGDPPADAVALPMAQMLRFVAGRGLAALGDQFLLFAIPLLVLKTTGSASLAGVGFLVEWLPRVLFMPFAGVLA